MCENLKRKDPEPKYYGKIVISINEYEKRISKTNKKDNQDESEEKEAQGCLQRVIICLKPEEEEE